MELPESPLKMSTPGQEMTDFLLLIQEKKSQLQSKSIRDAFVHSFSRRPILHYRSKPISNFSNFMSVRPSKSTLRPSVGRVTTKNRFSVATCIDDLVKRTLGDDLSLFIPSAPESVAKITDGVASASRDLHRVVTASVVADSGADAKGRPNTVCFTLQAMPAQGKTKQPKSPGVKKPARRSKAAQRTPTHPMPTRRRSVSSQQALSL
eukprot:TRINITY_DN8488_c0_g1_i1.p1 TRINITY_DN8488_c0_g1~~TRINITY_DN8488_c0_g1_i1.p1  ORF type:complete len:207 (-),score=12.42 TRINITY_DN8488_c0_g1_i1:247-867(-)